MTGVEVETGGKTASCYGRFGKDKDGKFLMSCVWNLFGGFQNRFKSN